MWYSIPICAVAHLRILSTILNTVFQSCTSDVIRSSSSSHMISRKLFASIQTPPTSSQDRSEEAQAFPGLSAVMRCTKLYVGTYRFRDETSKLKSTKGKIEIGVKMVNESVPTCTNKRQGSSSPRTLRIHCTCSIDNEQMKSNLDYKNTTYMQHSTRRVTYGWHLRSQSCLIVQSFVNHRSADPASYICCVVLANASRGQVGVSTKSLEVLSLCRHVATTVSDSLAMPLETIAKDGKQRRSPRQSVHDAPKHFQLDARVREPFYFPISIVMIPLY